LAAFVAVLVSSSLPFWLLLGSVRLHGLGLLLPASALMFVCPVVVATVLAAIEGGRAEVATLWRRSVDVTAARYAGWVAAVVLLPALVLLATLLDHGSVALPPALVPLAAVPLLTVVYLVTALAEEVGWTAYLTDRMLFRLGTTGTGLVLGAIWAAGTWCRTCRWDAAPGGSGGSAWERWPPGSSSSWCTRAPGAVCRSPSSCTPASTSPPRPCLEPERTSTRHPSPWS
jgi:hypothetical protein